MHQLLRPAVVVLAFSVPGAYSQAFAAADDIEAVVENVVNERDEGSETDAADEAPEDADPGEASYNTENCEQPERAAGAEVVEQDLDAACDQVVK